MGVGSRLQEFEGCTGFPEKTIMDKTNCNGSDVAYSSLRDIELVGIVAAPTEHIRYDM